MSYEEIRIIKITLRAARLQEVCVVSVKSGKVASESIQEHLRSCTYTTGYRDSRPFTSSRSPSHNFKLRASRPELRQLTSPTLSSVKYVVRHMPFVEIPSLSTTCQLHIRKAVDYICRCMKQLRSRRAVETNQHVACFIIAPAVRRSRVKPTINPAKATSEQLPSIQPLLFNAPQGRIPVGLYLMLSCCDRLESVHWADNCQ